MKTSRVVLFLVGTALIVLPARVARADDAGAPAAGSTTAPTGDQGARLEKLKAALAQLNLTDEQKAKMKDIFTNVPKGPERRQQIMAVLTPDQKEKLRQMIQDHRDANGTAAN